MIVMARRVLAFLLLGAAITLLSAWAIHGVQFWRAKSAGHGFVNPAMGYSYSFVIGIWTDDSQLAEQLGASRKKRGPNAALSLLERPWVLSVADADVDWATRFDPDSVWRRHRRVMTGIPPTPDLPYTLPADLATSSSFGWNAGKSLTFVVELDDDSRAILRSSSESLVLFDVGWPWRSVQSGTHHVEDILTQATTPPVSLTGGITLWTNNGQGPLDRFALPLFPLWPGFALNTLLFGTTLAVLWYVPVGVRRMGRSRAGRCLACGYDIEGLDTCPECGRPLVTTEP